MSDTDESNNNRRNLLARGADLVRHCQDIAGPEMQPEREDRPPSDVSHDWFKPDFIDYECCRKCGIVKRADGKNKPCRGVVHVVMREDDPDEIVGHKTFHDGETPAGIGGYRHEPLTRREADAIWAAADARKAKRAIEMPDERAALDAMHEAWLRLKELGWSEIMYSPKDGTPFSAIEPGSTGIHDCFYMGDWPKGSWWCPEAGDLWPSHPILWKSKDQS